MTIDSLFTVPLALILLIGIISFHLGSGGRISGVVLASHRSQKLSTKNKQRYKNMGCSLIVFGSAVFFVTSIAVIRSVWRGENQTVIGGITNIYSLPSTGPTPGNIVPTIQSAEQIPTQQPNPATLLQPLINSELGSAKDFLASFFDQINSAKNRNQLQPLWGYLTTRFQNSSSEGDINKFLDFWWTVQVSYLLQECSVNTIDIRLTYYNRGSNIPTSTDFIRYFIEVVNNEWKILGGNLLPSDSDFCQ